MIETNSAGGVILNKEGKILVVSQHGTSWSLPKGHLEGNENPLEAAKREIYEESGISQLEFIKELGNYKRFRISPDGKENKSELKNIRFFLFRTNQEGLKPVDKENPEAKWVEKKDVVKLLTHKKDKEFFLKYLKDN